MSVHLPSESLSSFLRIGCPASPECALKSYKEAKKTLKSAVDYLREISESAASSLEEGFEER